MVPYHQARKHRHFHQGSPAAELPTEEHTPCGVALVATYTRTGASNYSVKPTTSRSRPSHSLSSQDVPCNASTNRYLNMPHCIAIYPQYTIQASAMRQKRPMVLCFESRAGLRGLVCSSSCVDGTLNYMDQKHTGQLAQDKMRRPGSRNPKR